MNKRFKKNLDVLINCGWSGKNTFESISDQDWQYDIDTCLTGVFNCIKTFLPYLKRRREISSILVLHIHTLHQIIEYDSPKYSNPQVMDQQSWGSTIN